MNSPSFKQIEYANRLAATIARYTGEEVTDVKFIARRMALKRGYPFQRNEDGSIHYAPDGEVVGEIEDKVSARDIGHLIDELIQLAAETRAIASDT